MPCHSRHPREAPPKALQTLGGAFLSPDWQLPVLHRLVKSLDRILYVLGHTIVRRVDHQSAPPFVSGGGALSEKAVMKANYSLLVSAGATVSVPVTVSTAAKRPKERMLSEVGWVSLFAICGVIPGLVFVIAHLSA